MKLTIFGATGRTGQLLVKKALDAGYTVTAYARTPFKLNVKHSDINFIQGELSDLDTVADAIAGSGAVLSSLGAVRGGSHKVMVPAAASILAGMKKHNVKRLIWATGAGVPAPQDQPAFLNKVISFLLKLTAKQVLEDSLTGAEMIKASEFDWIIARGPMLNDEPGSGKYRVGYVSKEMGRTLSREDFAEFMLKQVESDEWLHSMPVVSNE